MNARLDFFSTKPHYAAHLLPLYRAMPPTFRGHFYAPAAVAMAMRGQYPDVDIKPGRPRGRGKLVAVAGYADYRACSQHAIVFVEHGAGQTYCTGQGLRDAHYSGGIGRERVVLFISPNPQTAARNAAAYPEAESVSVGDTLYMDAWRGRAMPRQDRGPVIAVSFRAPRGIVPEAGGAFAHYAEALPDLAMGPWDVLGHAHPRWGNARRAWEAMGIAFTPSWETVMRVADLYVVDSSSTAYEFASLGKPVLNLNAPAYRRDVHHGLRFWDYLPGLQCDEPGDLMACVNRALADPAGARTMRARAVEHVYPCRDGGAAVRAATAVLRMMGEEMPDEDGEPVQAEGAAAEA